MSKIPVLSPTDVTFRVIPIVTFQYSSTTLYQFSHHIQSLFL
jgi:hypothetical protein